MCFINNLNQKSAKVAENDIECYKFLMEYQGLTSPFYRYEWTEKEEKSADIADEVEEDEELDCGFHSCKTLENCRDYRAHADHETICSIYKFIIPKGASYYENDTQYLSNKIYLASKEPVEPVVEVKFQPVSDEQF